MPNQLRTQRSNQVIMSIDITYIILNYTHKSSAEKVTTSKKAPLNESLA